MNARRRMKWHDVNTIVNHYPMSSVTSLICMGCAAELVNVPFVLFVVNSQPGHS
jgi:hypothetical protein